MLYGFALECTDCAPGEGARGRGRGRGRASGGGGRGAPVVWSYHSFPHVVAVAPGSAAEQAGIKAGDVLRSIDGLSVLTQAGAARLAHATDGEQVRLGFTRNAKSIDVSLVLGSTVGRKPGSRPAFIGTGYMALQTGGPLKGAMKMEIWSDDPMIFSTDSSSASPEVGVMVLKIGTRTLIRLQLTKDSTNGPGGPSGRGSSDGSPGPRF